MKVTLKITTRRSILLFCLLISTQGCLDRVRDDRVYVPEHYYGWVRIEYGVKGAPGLSKVSFHDGEPNFHESGLLRTSSELQRDSATAEIYYGTVMEVRPVPNDMIFGRFSSTNVVKPDGSRFAKQFEIFFLGPAEFFNKHKRELERFKNSKGEYVIPSLNDLPKVGNLR